MTEDGLQTENAQKSVFEEGQVQGENGHLFGRSHDPIWGPKMAGDKFRGKLFPQF